MNIERVIEVLKKPIDNSKDYWQASEIAIEALREQLKDNEDTGYEHIFPEPPELNYCPRCGSDSVYQSQSSGAMKCEECELECHVIEWRDEE